MIGHKFVFPLLFFILYTVFVAHSNKFFVLADLGHFLNSYAYGYIFEIVKH